MIKAKAELVLVLILVSRNFDLAELKNKDFRVKIRRVLALGLGRAIRNKEL